MGSDFNRENKNIDKIEKTQSNRNIVLASSFCDEANCSLKNSEVLNIQEVSDYLRLSKGSLLNIIFESQIPFYKLGRRYRYLRSDLLQVMIRNLNKKMRRNNYGN